MNILSLGDLLLDVSVRYDPASGEADQGEEAVQIGPGGSAANFAVHAARLGAAVRFVSRVGPDWAGEMLVRSLQDDGVTPAVRTVDVPTGKVLIMVDPGGHRRMWSYPGASSTISPDDLDPAWFDGIDAFHLTGYSLLREGPRAAARYALKLARGAGTPICTLDPNPPHLIATYGAAVFRRVLEGLGFDILLPNLEEGKLLSGEESPKRIVASLLELCPTVALKLGSEGCLVADRSQTLMVPAQSHLSAVDATGAGDAFAAGFVVEFGTSRDLEAAARRANAVAAAVVQRVGAR